MKKIYKFISTSMRPENDQNSDFPKQSKIEPQQKLQKEPFKQLLALVGTISNIEQYYNDFLYQEEYYKQKHNILRQFNLFTENKKAQIILKLEFVIQTLLDKNQIQDQDPAKIKIMRLSFRQFKHDLVNSKKYNESNKQEQRESRNTKFSKLTGIQTKSSYSAFQLLSLFSHLLPASFRSGNSERSYQNKNQNKMLNQKKEAVVEVDEEMQTMIKHDHGHDD